MAKKNLQKVEIILDMYFYIYQDDRFEILQIVLKISKYFNHFNLIVHRVIQIFIVNREA